MILPLFLLNASDGTNPNIDTIALGISNIVEDTDTLSQLGGHLDFIHNKILMTHVAILDENWKQHDLVSKQQKVSSKPITYTTNAATGNAPSIQATGDDSNVKFKNRTKRN